MKNKKLITVNVAIAAYNSETNIRRLVESVLKQHAENFELKNIIVNSDGSSDKTVAVVKSIKDKRIKIIESRKRSGFAGAIARLIKNINSDILLILNDDVVISDINFLEKTVITFIKESTIGLVCCNIQPLKPDNFISGAVRSGFNAYQKMGQYIKNGNNVYTCDGKALCISKQFAKSLKLPVDLKLIGNVDHYIYFSCLKNKFKYRYAPNAIIYFKCPSTVKDFIKWQIRNYKSNIFVFRKTFGKLAAKEYEIPANIFNKYKFTEFIKNPLGSIFIFMLGLYCSYKAKNSGNEYELTWDPVKSTKQL